MSKLKKYALYFIMQIMKKNVLEQISMTICRVHFKVRNAVNYGKYVELYITFEKYYVFIYILFISK